MKSFESWMNGVYGGPVEVPSSDVALVVVDMQNAFCKEEWTLGVAPTQEPFADAIPGTRALIDAARSAGVPVIFTRVNYHVGGADAPALRARARPPRGAAADGHGHRRDRDHR